MLLDSPLLPHLLGIPLLLRLLDIDIQDSLLTTELSKKLDTTGCKESSHKITPLKNKSNLTHNIKFSFAHICLVERLVLKQEQLELRSCQLPILVL